MAIAADAGSRTLADESAYLDAHRKLVEARWPQDLPREPIYPFGEIPLTDYLRRWAETAPDRVAVDFYGHAITYAELDAQADRFAAMLQQAGAAPGARVALFMGNCPQFIVGFLGILRAGCVHVPVNPMFREHELEYELNDAQAEYIVAQDVLVPLVEQVRPKTSVKKVWSTGMADLIPEAPAWPVPASIVSDRAAAGGAEDLAEAMANAPAKPEPVEVDLDALCKLNYTGGTTGMPKGCVHTQRDMIYTAATVQACGNRLQPGEVMINFYPLFWMAGEDVGLIFPIFSGATCVLLGRWDPVGFMAAVQARKATAVKLLVDNAVELMDHPRVGEFDLTSIEKTQVSSFVKKLNGEFRARWKALTGSVMAEAAWGMTETQTCDTFTTGFQTDDYDLSLQPIFVGLPMPGTEFKICDFDTGALAPFGEEGEICIRSPSILKEYWNKPEATAASIKGGFLHTGDIGVIDELGFLHFLGRRKEMLKVRGMSVFPAEIEAMLGRHPAILGSGVIGREDPDKGQVPVAFVVLDRAKAQGLDAKGIEAWCGEAMATYKRPEVRLVDSLPMTATGKVKKDELAKLL
ncbi:AMP-binding protein [Albimonas sp. CAU 1670]|uniref:AMP-binding protein n=1 Tax=Albimonas sp. CAU 1670 TaxID=3032599 RepID=UPI0023DC784F|nr:AMP-binding protein [Albimonas sp. CAU 1670]MDF2234123.1 AMP-binding protein [Albimonas sp. CAU 1670]